MEKFPIYHFIIDNYEKDWIELIYPTQILNYNDYEKRMLIKGVKSLVS